MSTESGSARYLEYIENYSEIIWEENDTWYLGNV